MGLQGLGHLAGPFEHQAEPLLDCQAEQEVQLESLFIPGRRPVWRELQDPGFGKGSRRPVHV
jgi:hypothetical protein